MTTRIDQITSQADDIRPSAPPTRPSTPEAIRIFAEAVTRPNLELVRPDVERPGGYSIISENQKDVQPTAEAQNGAAPTTQRSESGEYLCARPEVTPEEAATRLTSRDVSSAIKKAMGNPDK